MPEITEYKGHSLLVLNAGDKFPFQFGLGKAKLILEHLDAIRAFVESDGKECGESSQPKQQPDF